jgi:hypothetical protein
MENAFELKNLFRNVYFWLAVGGFILLLYVGFIALTFLPRSSSEVTKDENPQDSKGLSADAELKKKSRIFENVRVSVNQNGGWVDSDDRQMTIVLQVTNLKSEIVEEIIRNNGISIQINRTKAEIINSEPYKKTGFLTRAKAVLSPEVIDKFNFGETQYVEIDTSLNVNGEEITKNINRRFAKRNKTEVEGIKIAWK